MDTQKYEAVRKAVIAAVPEIAEVCRGQEINHFCPNCSTSFGRPIRLADVLVAIGKQPVPRYWCAVDCDGDFHDMEHEGIALSNGYRWNLRQDDLSLQSPETIDFLHSILVK